MSLSPEQKQALKAKHGEDLLGYDFGVGMVVVRPSTRDEFKAYKERAHRDGNTVAVAAWARTCIVYPESPAELEAILAKRAGALVKVSDGIEEMAGENVKPERDSDSYTYDFGVGKVTIRPPSQAEFRCFQDRIKADGDSFAGTEEVARSCVVEPADPAALDALLEKRVAALTTLGVGIVELAGIGEHVRVEKL